MAGYEVILKNETGGSSEGGNNFPDGKDGEKDAKPEGNVFKKRVQAFAAGYAKLAIVRQIFSYEISRIGIETGNSHLQEKAQFWYSLAEQAIGIGIATALNPVAGALSLGGIAIGYAQRIDAYNYERGWEGIALQQRRRRVGPSFNRSRQT